MSLAVERADAVATARIGELLQADSPFVINDSADERTREAVWSPSGLRALVGRREVQVTQSDSGIFAYTDDGRPLYSEVPLPFDEALDLIASSKSPGPFYYLRRSLLAELGLDNEAVLPTTFKLTPGAKKSERLWISSAGSITPLHYDTRNNLLAQMYGSKLVTLFSSLESERMYPLEFSGTNLLSEVDSDAVDESRFPNFPSESRITVELKPGDTIFIPPFWWHHVRSLEFSISVNVFWQLRPEQCLVPNSIEYLRIMYKRNGLADLFPGDEQPDQLRFAKLAECAHELGLNTAATLFGAASARLTLQTMPASSVGAVAAGVGEDREAYRTKAGEQAKLEHFILLGALAALHGQTPKSSALRDMLWEVSQFATSAAAT